MLQATAEQLYNVQMTGYTRRKLHREANANNNSRIKTYDGHGSGELLRYDNGGKAEEKGEEERDLDAVPAWRRQISGPSLGGRRRRPIVAERGPLENSTAGKKEECVFDIF